MKLITLKLIGDSWMAAFHGPESDRIKQLFGTATIPTPYTHNAPESFVVETIRSLNPGYLVEVCR